MKLVGVRGFEPPAPASRRQCSTRLSYTPTVRLPIRRGGAFWQGLFGPNLLVSALTFAGAADQILEPIERNERQKPEFLQENQRNSQNARLGQYFTRD